MKDLIGGALVAAALFVIFTPLLFARQITVRRHKEQFKATGGAEFALPPSRGFRPEAEEPEPVARPGGEASTLQLGFDAASAPTAPMAILDTETGELVRVDADGLPLSAADLSARTAPTTFTVDTERLAEILTLEETGEYILNTATWAEIGAAEAFMRDPLGSAVLPPIPLTEEAGTPGLEATFYAVLARGGLRDDWDPADSEFHFWDVETSLEPVAA